MSPTFTPPILLKSAMQQGMVVEPAVPQAGDPAKIAPTPGAGETHSPGCKVVQTAPIQQEPEICGQDAVAQVV